MQIFSNFLRFNFTKIKRKERHTDNTHVTRIVRYIVISFQNSTDCLTRSANETKARYHIEYLKLGKERETKRLNLYTFELAASSIAQCTVRRTR